MNGLKLELCVASVEAIDLASKYGFDRVELCQSLEQGGLTPSAGLVDYAINLGLSTHVLIRPRAGGFCYSHKELTIIQREIDNCRRIGAQGVVVGILMENYNVDKLILKSLKECAPELEWTFHRAFDESIDWKHSLDVLVDIGFNRVLTSGFASNVELGLAELSEMCAYAKNNIEIMAGGGVNAGNIFKIANINGLSGIHFSATQKVLLDEDSAFSETILRVSESKLKRILSAI